MAETLQTRIEQDGGEIRPVNAGAVDGLSAPAGAPRRLRVPAVSTIWAWLLAITLVLASGPVPARTNQVDSTVRRGRLRGERSRSRMWGNVFDDGK
jgi:hypothetical protein